MKNIFTTLIIFLFPLLVYGSDMDRIKSLNCAYVSDNHFTIDPKKPMSEMFKGSGVVKTKMTVRITNIDLVKNTAKIIGSNNTVEVVLIRNDMGFTLLEMHPSEVHTIVVYDTKTKNMDGNHFPTIHSRNLLIGKTGVSSQLSGVCRAKF
jgi:hypothetical protein